MSVPSEQSPAQLLSDLRRRADAFFGDPRAAALVAAVDPPAPAPAATAAEALNSRVADTLRRLGIPLGPTAGFELRKSITMHDGRVVAMTGEPEPLGPNEQLRVVTATTSVLDQGRLRSETTVLIFERSTSPVIAPVVEP